MRKCSVAQNAGCGGGGMAVNVKKSDVQGITNSCLLTLFKGRLVRSNEHDCKTSLKISLENYSFTFK